MKKKKIGNSLWVRDAWMSKNTNKASLKIGFVATSWLVLVRHHQALVV